MLPYTAFAETTEISVDKLVENDYNISFSVDTESSGATVFLYGPIKGDYDTQLSFAPNGEYKDFYVHHAEFVPVYDGQVYFDFNVKLNQNILILLAEYQF